MRRSARARLAKVITSFIAERSGGTYRDAPNRLERLTLEATSEASRLRFIYQEQRAVLDFGVPRTRTAVALAPRPFGGFDDDGHARTQLRFWIRSTREARIEPHADSIAGPWHADARRHIEALQLLGSRRGIGIALTAEGLFIVKYGWLGLSLDANVLGSFVDEACALVSLHLDGRLLSGDPLMRRSKGAASAIDVSELLTIRALLHAAWPMDRFEEKRRGGGLLVRVR